uniref:DUF3987 domain-containing protein n=1 Tax=Roseivirga sp. TaxID=1964215 RepID=UPI004048035E
MNEQRSWDNWRIQKGESIATKTTPELLSEIDRRKERPQFPLWVFNDAITQFLELLHKEYDLPRSFIGLGLLSAYSTAIGTAYHVRMKKLGDIYLALWGCFEGESSSGKSLTISQLFRPHNSLQNEYDNEWEMNHGEKPDSAKELIPYNQIIYRDAHTPTLIRYLLPFNPKGLLKDSDEILEWVNGMNQLSKKEGTDEQFWLSTWNCKDYTAHRSGNKRIKIKKPYLNVLGGIQPTVTWKLFKNDRATTGFIFRLLFAVDERNKFVDPNLEFDMPPELEKLHQTHISKLYKQLSVDDVDDDSKSVIIEPKALKMYLLWKKEKIAKIDRMTDAHDRNVHKGIMGKIAEYVIRFVGILHVSDVAYTDRPFMAEELASVNVMQRAIELGEYFYASAVDVTERAETSITAPPEVLRFASYQRLGWSNQKIGDTEFGTKYSEEYRKKKAGDILKKMIQKYPKIFNALAN